jgi:ferredoxin-NADP reductase
MSKNNFIAFISKNEWISPKVRLVTINLPTAQAMSYSPGQFISIHLPHPEGEEKPIRRSYSIATIIPNTDAVTSIEIVLTIVEDGIASQFLDNAKAGDEVEISGPYGALTLPEELPSRLFLVATSTGVAPYRTMLPTLEALLNSDTEIDIELILGVSSEKECLFADDFREFSLKYPHFQFNACYSRHTEGALAEDEYKGYVQERLEALAPNPKNDLVYLCGNPKMVDGCTGLLTELGFSPRQVKREKYVRSKR